MKRLEGKVAIITGAATGIGLQTAQIFVQNGAKVIITDRNREAGEKAVSNLGDYTLFFEQDVTDEGSWSSLAAFALETFGPPDIFVNNAGILATGDKQDLETTDLDQWRKVQAVNVEGVFMGCKIAVGLMKETGGSLINLSSIAGKQATPSVIAYGASKAAVAQLTKSVASHCKRKGYAIRCNSVHPNPIKTAMGDKLMTQIGGTSEAGWQIFEQIKEYGGAGEPSDVANSILFLASDESRHINASELMVDGGMLGLT